MSFPFPSYFSPLKLLMILRDNKNAQFMMLDK